MSTIISSQVLLNVITREKKNSGATFTIQSVKMGKDFTYSISRNEFKGKWYTHVKVEMGYLNFVRIGTYFNGKIFNKGAVVTTPTANAIGYILSLVEKGKFEWLDTQMKVMHTGSCLCCGRTLTDAHSIQLGLGPTCASFN